MLAKHLNHRLLAIQFIQMLSRQTSYLFCVFLIKAALCTLPFTANQKYSYAGRATIDVNQQNALNGGSNWTNGINITIVYPRSYDYNLNFSAIASIGDFSTDYLSDRINIYLQTTQVEKTSMKIIIATVNSSKIQKLAWSYFFYLQQSIDKYNFAAYEAIYIFESSMRSINSTVSTWFSLYVTIPPFNLTSQSRNLVFLGGLHAYGGYSNTYSLFFDVSMKNSTLMVLTVGSNSALSTQLRGFFVQFFLYNPQYIKGSEVSYQFYDGSISKNSSNYGPFVSDGRAIKQFNTLYGISAFSISYKGSFSLSMLFYSDTEMRANTGVNFDSFTYNILSIYSRYCNYKTNYYEEYNHQCYQTCPGTTQPSVTLLKCFCLDQFGNKISNSLCSLNKTTNNTSTNTTNNSSLNNWTDTNTTNNSTNSSASNTTLNPSNSLQTSSENYSSGLPLIIGSAIGAAALLSTFIVIYCYCKKKQNLPQEKNQTKYEIRFDEIPSNKSAPIQQKEHQRPSIYNSKYPRQYPHLSLDNSLQFVVFGINPNETISNLNGNIDQQIQQPNYHPSNEFATACSATVNDKKVVEKDCKKQQQKWMKCQIYNPQNLCSICQQPKGYLEIECGHSFHISCLTDWMKKKTTCPNCIRNITIQAKYYCNKCEARQKYINLTAIQNLSNIKRQCVQCAQIPI